jgi:hypothetical protein
MPQPFADRVHLPNRPPTGDVLMEMMIETTTATGSSLADTELHALAEEVQLLNDR